MARWYLIARFRPWHRNGKDAKTHVIIDANAPCADAEGCARTLCGHRYALATVIEFWRGGAAGVTCIPCRRRLAVLSAHSR